VQRISFRPYLLIRRRRSTRADYRHLWLDCSTSRQVLAVVQSRRYICPLNSELTSSRLSQKGTRASGDAAFISVESRAFLTPSLVDP